MTDQLKIPEEPEALTLPLTNERLFKDRQNWINYSRDMEAFCQQQAATIEQLNKKLAIAELKNKGTLANNLCYDHRDKQVGQPCLACTIEQLRGEVERKESDRQYHMNAINRLAKFLGFWGTSDDVIEQAADNMKRFIREREQAEARVKVLEAALKELVDQIDKGNPVDDHGHDFKMNKSFIDGRDYVSAHKL